MALPADDIDPCLTRQCNLLHKHLSRREKTSPQKEAAVLTVRVLQSKGQGRVTAVTLNKIRSSPYCGLPCACIRFAPLYLTLLWKGIETYIINY
jgi:hypothetical protein